VIDQQISPARGGIRRTTRLRGTSLPLLLALAALLLLSAAFLWSAPLQQGTSFSLGGVGAPLAQSFQLAETTPDGRGFRWTDGDSALRLPAQGASAHMLRISLSAPRPAGPERVPVRISINGRTVLEQDQDEQLRDYSFFVPADQMRWGVNEVRIQSPTFQPQELNRADRQLGVAVFDVSWDALAAPGWLAPAQIALVALALALFALLLARYHAPPWPAALAVALMAIILLAMRHGDSRFVYRWHALATTLGVCVVLAAALWPGRRGQGADEPLAAPRTWVARHWLALAGYLAATAVMLAPLLPRLTTDILGAPGDNWEYLWKMQWFGEALLARHTSPVYAPQLFFPNGVDLTGSEIAPAQHLLYVPLTLLLGPIVSYNLNMIASFVLSGFFTYLLADRLGVRRGAAFVAGLIFAFSVRRFFHATGHFGIIASQWLPLLLYAWEGLLTRRRSWDALLAGVAYALAVWSSMIYGVTAPLFVAGYTIFRLGPRGLLPALQTTWRKLTLMAAVTIALVAPAVQPYIEAQSEGLTYQHQYTQLALHAARPGDYLLPNPFHPLWGAWATQLYPAAGGEHYASPGYATLALALVGLWLGRRRRAVQALGLMLLVFAVLSLGPELSISDTTQIPLPAKLLYLYLPAFGNIRTWGRMVFYVMLCAGLLAAVALDRLPIDGRQAGARSRRGAQVAWLLAGAWIMFESAAVVPLSTVQPRPVDLWLRGQPGDGAVVNMPHKAGAPDEFLTLLYTDKPVSQGHGTFTPAAFREAQDIYYRFPDESSLRLMQRWQVDYIVVDDAQIAQQRADWRAALEALRLVTRVYTENGFSVYRLQR